MGRKRMLILSRVIFVMIIYPGYLILTADTSASQATIVAGQPCFINFFSRSASARSTRSWRRHFPRAGTIERLGDWLRAPE